MARIEQLTLIVVITFSTLLASGAQGIPALSISPAKVTMLPGETRTFRAVGKDGRIRHNVRWSISPGHAAKLVANGDEAEVEAGTESPTLTLTASAEGDSAEATVEILPGHTMPSGTVLWKVDPLPGCKSTNLVQAVPSANGPDLYDQEECPQGAFVRALTADGREMWRRQLTGAGGSLSSAPVAKPQTDTGQHLDLHRTSVCDRVSPGMTKEDVSKLVSGRSLTVQKKQWQSDTWEFEEEGSRCAISFDGKSGAVVKKKKTIIID